MANNIKWVGGEHDFALDIGALRAVQDACNAGPQEIVGRLLAGSWRVDDPLQVLRHGLIGGGMLKAEAARLVENMANTHGLLRLVSTAQLVLSAALVGVPDDPVGDTSGEPDGVALKSESGSSAASTPQEPPQGSPRETLTA